ncbi:MAG: (deoxy)nucleoside triphosphate pyrophosphohydrolase [Rhodanobacter sp.]
MRSQAVAPPAAMHVVAGVLMDADGRVLLAQRRAGKHLAGFWEFPGGKLEPGEAPRDALARELREELGIDVLDAAPLVRVPSRQHDRDLLLDVWRVSSWRGVPLPLEGQPLKWLVPAKIDPMTLAPADRVILTAL